MTLAGQRKVQTIHAFHDLHAHAIFQAVNRAQYAVQPESTTIKRDTEHFSAAITQDGGRRIVISG